MKLCKDCKHVHMPNPLANLNAAFGSPWIAMCGHPEAERSVVDGSLRTSCESARRPSTIYEVSSGICAGAKLFEERPKPGPVAIMKPVDYAATYGGAVEPERDRSLWERVKHWFD